MSLIQAKHLSKTYTSEGEQTLALNDASFSIQKGEWVAIMGPSGSGKSTLLHLLGFLERPTSGEYWFDGQKSSVISDDALARLRNEKIGFVFQSFNLLPKTTVLENVKLPLLYSRIPSREWDSRAHRVIEAVGLKHRVNHEPSQLSGGEKQRVAIARALINDPDVIFADEPTGNLDSKNGAMVMEILKKLHQEKKHTIILITHDPNIAQYAGRIITMKDGRVEKEVSNKL